MKTVVLWPVIPAFQELIGYSSEELMGESLQALNHVIDSIDNIYDENQPAELNPLDALLDGVVDTVEASLKRKGGSNVWVNLYLGVVEVPSTTVVSKSYILIAENITEKKLAADKMREMAYYDSLTRLPNRVLFSKELDRAVSHARAMGFTVCRTLLGFRLFPKRLMTALVMTRVMRFSKRYQSIYKAV